jgi:hypothetical protein
MKGEGSERLKSLELFKSVFSERVRESTRSLNQFLSKFTVDETGKRKKLKPLLPTGGVSLQTFMDLTNQFERVYLATFDTVIATQKTDFPVHVKAYGD